MLTRSVKTLNSDPCFAIRKCNRAFLSATKTPTSLKSLTSHQQRTAKHHSALPTSTWNIMKLPPIAMAAGVWQRQWEEDPLGDEEGADRDTLVLWTQSSQSGIYVDIRLPKESPGRSIEAARAIQAKPNPGALAATDGPQCSHHKECLQKLLQQKSFAGVLDVKLGDTTDSGDALKKDSELLELTKCKEEGAIPLNTCFWRRDIDYQPPSGGLDIGVCASGPPDESDGSVLLRETGDDASYAEGWLRLPGTEKGPFTALKLISENGKDRDGYWVRAGSRFAYAVGRPNTVEAARDLKCLEDCTKIKDCVGMNLSKAVESLTTDEEKMVRLALSYVAVAGEIDKDGKWQILHGTNPDLVGCTLFGNPNNDSLCCSRLTLDSSGRVQQHIEHDMRRVTRVWEVVEQVDCELPYAETVLIR